MKTSRALRHVAALVAAAAPVLASAPAHALPNFCELFRYSDFRGCYASVTQTNTNLKTRTYGEELSCDLREGSCLVNSARPTVCFEAGPGEQDDCCDNSLSDTWPMSTSGDPIKSTYLHHTALGNVCICGDTSGDHNCITLGKSGEVASDLSQWPMDFTAAKYEEGGCSSDELVQNWDRNTYPTWEVTTADAAAAGGQYTIVSNQYGTLVFADNGDLALRQVGSTFHDTIWHSDTAGVGYKVSFQSDGNLCIRDANVHIVWCSDTYAGGGPTGKAAMNLRIQENCNVTMWADDGTLVWTTDTPFCSAEL